MRGLIKTIGNALFVVGGFLVIFWGVSKVWSKDDQSGSFILDGNGGVVHADIPYSTPYGYPTPADPGAGGGGSGDGGGGK